MTEIIQTNLLIGGPYDRQTLRYDVGDMPWVYLPAPQWREIGRPPKAGSGDMPVRNKIAHHTYHREDVTMRGYQFLFWRHESLEPHDAFKALFAAYGNGDTAP